MVTPIVGSGPNKIDARRTTGPEAVRIAASNDGKPGVHATPAARFASLGPPIDVTRVNEVRAAIASGRYTVDADRLAAAMMALDLPAKDR